MPPTRTSLSGLVSMVTAPFRRGRITSSAIPSGGGPGAGAPVWSYGGSNSGPAGQPGSGWNAAPGNTPDISQFAPTFQPSGSLFSPVYPLVPVERELLRVATFRPATTTSIRRGRSSRSRTASSGHWRRNR